MVKQFILTDTKTVSDIKSELDLTLDIEDYAGLDTLCIDFKSLNKEDKKRCLCDILELNYYTSTETILQTLKNEL